MKLKRWIASLMVGISILAVAGCGSTGDTKKADPKPTTTETITVSAAASMKAALEEIKANYIKKQNLKDEQVAINFAGSGSLRQQIEQGAPSSLFISADEKNMKQLQEKNLVEEVKPLVGNDLVLVVPKGKEPFTMKTIQTAPRIVLGTLGAVPAGDYAKSALDKLNLWGEVESKVVFAKDVKAVTATISQGAGDVGFIYKTDAIAAKDKVDITDTVAADLHAPIVYPIGVVTKNKNGLTKDFYQYLMTPEAQKVFEKYGFKSVSK